MLLWVPLFCCLCSSGCSRGISPLRNTCAFQAGAWYWHFVDVVWICLFFFVYVL
ncbi:cytochrome c oxidase subunit 3 [Alishewanella longhuensis]